MNCQSHNSSNCHLSLVSKHSTLLQWHSVHNLQGNIAADLHQSGCICKLVVVLKEQHSPEESSSVGNKSIKAILPPSLAVKKSIPRYVKSKQDLILIFYIRHGVMMLSTTLLKLVTKHLHLFVCWENEPLPLYI